LPGSSRKYLKRPSSRRKRISPPRKRISPRLGGNKQADRQLARLDRLAENQYISTADKESGESSAEIAKAQADAASKRRGSSTRVGPAGGTQSDLRDDRSPIDGIVVSRNIDVGQTGGVVISGADPLHDRPRPAAHANRYQRSEATSAGSTPNESDIHCRRISRGDVQRDCSPGAQFPTTIQNVVTYDAVIDIPNPNGKLKPGMTANVLFILDEKEAVLRVPRTALRFHPTRKCSAMQVRRPLRPAPIVTRYINS